MVPHDKANDELVVTDDQDINVIDLAADNVS